MMPFRKVIAKNLEILATYAVDMIAPSHGQVYDKTEWILEAYRDWVLSPPHNLVMLSVQWNHRPDPNEDVHSWYTPVPLHPASNPLPRLA